MSGEDTESNSSSGFDMDQVVVSRDDQGLIVPEEVYVEEFDDTVVARPMNKAAREKYIQPFIEAMTTTSAMAEGDIDVESLTDDQRGELEGMIENALSDEMMAELFDTHIVEPDLVAAYQANYPDEEIDELDERFVDQDLKVGAIDGLLFAILLVSDMEEFVEALRKVGEREVERAEAEDEDADEDDQGNSE